MATQTGVEEVHILWISEGLSCDGDTVSITAATQPALEDVVLGLIPGLPKVTLHNKVLAFETGDEFMEAFRKAERGELGPFVLVIEGSIPNEQIHGEGFWSGFGTDPATGQPRWTHTPPGFVLSAMAVAVETLAVASNRTDGSSTLELLDVRDGSVLRAWSSASATYAPPIYARGLLVWVTSDGHVVALGR